MTKYRVTLKPVYSCPASELPAGINLPEGWSSLSWHQVETFNALNNSNIDVVFNTAMTGDGKSLAAYLQVLQGKCCAIGLYPTNELARDQETQTQEYITKFQPPSDLRVVRLSGAELEIYSESEGLRKGAALSTRSSQSEVLLTNPDIFHYLHRGAYLIPKDSPDKLWGRIDKDFDLFIFDEFHVFAAPQIASVINTLLLIRCTNRRKKFLFLSATPDEHLIRRLRIAGFRCQEINPVQQGKYQFPDRLDKQTQLQATHWRQVARAIQLKFVPLASGTKASETWLKENCSLIREQFQNHPGSKGAIILNSIAAVKRLTPFFQELLQSLGLTVGENTGLSGKTIREQSLAADLVLGTSTIDVGVDFKINFLIFESSDAGNFIQRLGRLGRHDWYNRDGQRVDFNGFTAYALVPNFFVERLFAGDSPPLATEGVYDRPFLNETVWEQYRTINDFAGYYKRWGAFQSLFLGRKLADKTIQQQYAGSLASFQHDCEQVFDRPFSQLAGLVKGWAKGWQILSGKKEGNPIYEDACSFRGSSLLQCGLYDLTEVNEADRFKTYDLSGILSNLEIEPWTEAGFLRSLQETATRTQKPIPKGRFAHCLAFMKLVSYREERSIWKFTYPGDLTEPANAWKVQVLTGLEVWQPENRWVGELNKRLRQQGLVCYLLCRPVSEVRIRLQLPMHFQIYPISDQHSVHDAIAPYAIAFGQSALLLDTLAYRFKTKGGDPMIF
ncbi:DEAD/DEAH box helicase [Neosynechococcus sphagnicola sy1]|uniref:DEAD/DEAH box helicase n=1 Tax=Neosynechococcus sphagnicola sy1 TaxID=1497020 RepID=A0A098TP23_9CYAN|nr:type I-D CRISPR-associated helicase Cas3' [Neosynechococcus sphagnicola]KGF74054.1 DEAD/DEAH box helicase [Neosynechococcus sphagnicola sy1]